MVTSFVFKFRKKRLLKANSCFQNKNKLEAVAAAKKVVNQWVEKGNPKAKNNESEMCSTEFDVTVVSRSALAAVAKVFSSNLKLSVLFPEYPLNFFYATILFALVL